MTVEIIMNEEELNLIVNNYIKHIVIDDYPHYLLIMDEYGIVDIYNKDKYCILEVLQDIDSINNNHNIETNLYEQYDKRYYTREEK